MQKMNHTFTKTVTNRVLIITLYALLAVGASVQPLILGTKTYTKNGREYNRYNNYTIFKKSYDHLKNKQDLYTLYPDEYWDLYKYTPAFSVFFGFFNKLPDWLGLTLWNLLNAFIVLVAVYYLPRLNFEEKGFILLILSIELMTSMQNAQSNGLMAGLFVLSFGLLENKKYFLASLLIVFSVFIKLFGIVGFVLFIFYPKKWKLIAYSLLLSALFFIIPLIFVNFNQYLTLLQSYFKLLTNDYSSSYGYSVMGWLNSWFGLEINKNIIVLSGTVVLLSPLIRVRQYKYFMFRYLTLSAILIWVVIFNHKAESPTFIIAMTGVALWFIKSKKDYLNITLFVLTFVLTSLSPTDLFPKIVRDNYVIPYALKAFPCILIWVKIIYDLIVFNPDNTKTASVYPQ